MRIILLTLISVALPIGWFIADLRGGIRVRRILGVLAVLWSFAVAALVGMLQAFDANAYFSAATKQLLTESVTQLNAGRTDAVVRAWSHAKDQINPTYENRGRYQEIVDEATTHMKQP